MDRISFTWNGREYTVKKEAVGKEFIVLPNRKVLRVTSWDDKTVEEVNNNLQHASVGEIAEHMDGALAQEAD